ncbi:MAG: membrane integrity-associated transporter subunit PqiC [Magnetococcales bacterium]|nr:membrane integrity-associated transporter subunit PqiC [Magnetococcales bacterium]
MKWHTATGLVVIFLVLSGCARMLGTTSPPTRYFVISPLTLDSKLNSLALAKETKESLDKKEIKVVEPTKQTEIGIALEPLQIPSYLDRAEIVVRTGDNELDIAEFNKWGENIQSNLSRTLIENLSLLFESDKIYLIPSKKRRFPNFRVAVRIKKFERGFDGITILSVRWMLYSPDKKILFRESVLLKGQEVDKDDYPKIVKAMSSLWVEFSQRIVDSVNKQQANMIEK